MHVRADIFEFLYVLQKCRGRHVQGLYLYYMHVGADMFRFVLVLHVGDDIFRFVFVLYACRARHFQCYRCYMHVGLDISRVCICNISIQGPAFAGLYPY